MVKKDKKKLIIRILVGIVFVCMLSWYAFAAFIEVNSKIPFGYQEKMPTKYVAHRGLSSEYYQNSYSAFYYANKTPFFGGIECDIWRTLDGVWVCCHDDTPFVDKSIKVTKSNFSDIENLPLDTTDKGEFVDSKDVYITTYEKYLGIMRYSDKKAFVEIKSEYSQEVIGELVKYTIERCNIARVIFISFYKNALENVLLYRRFTSVMLLSKDVYTSYFYAKMGYNVGLNKKIVDKKEGRIELLHTNKSFAYIYTVNSFEEAEKYENLGADYIATDYILKQ
jgi:glycerophosphoryl diester phosphodiesterase